MIIAFTAAELLTPIDRIRNAVVLVEDGKIRALGSRDGLEIPKGARIEDYENGVLAPGLVDLHFHGAAGHDVMEPTPAALAAIERAIASYGVTTYLPTTMTAPVETTLRALEHLAGAIEKRTTRGEPDRAHPVGIHMEGPFISRTKRGVHPPENIAEPSVSLFERFWQAARGHIKLMTIAPEVPGALELIQHATKRGVVCSIGHSDALAADARAAIHAGARHTTHTFNAMRPLDHREPGILGVVLSDPRLTAEIICDGVHVDPAIVEVFLRAKGAERAVLITDAISATGMGDGRYRLATIDVEVRGLQCLHEGKLAGSVLTLDAAVRNVVEFAGWELDAAVRLASLNPARVAGLSGKGLLAPGADADLIVLTPTGEVIETICGGML